MDGDGVVLGAEPAPQIGDVMCEDTAPDLADEPFGVRRAGPQAYEGEAGEQAQYNPMRHAASALTRF